MNKDFAKACGGVVFTSAIGALVSGLVMKAMNGVSNLIESKKAAHTTGEEPLTVETENEKEEN